MGPVEYISVILLPHCLPLTDTRRYVVMEALWLNLQFVPHEVLHHAGHQRHLRLGEDVDQLDHLGVVMSGGRDVWLEAGH